jgi:microcystin-dependent protein
MTTPINIGQPTLALPQSIVVSGTYPGFQGGPLGSGTSSSLGFIISTVFDPSRISELALANAATIEVGSNQALFSLIGSYYGGNGSSNFSLPNLQGAIPQYVNNGSSSTQWGQVVGSPSNSVTLNTAMLPESLGGSATPIDITQYGVGIQYLIQTQWLFPSGSSPTPYTIGMIYPSAMAAGGGVPDGFLPADGRLLSINEYQVLFTLLGNTYGGDGVNNFALPDLRNRVPVGVGLSSTGMPISLGQKFGHRDIQLLQDELKGGVPIQTSQPSLALNYIVNTTGTYAYLSEDSPMLGQISLYAGRLVPDGWASAYGQLMSISGNYALYSLVKTTFGGDGITTFALPNLQGRSIVGTGGEKNLQIGNVQGNFYEYITVENLPEVMVFQSSGGSNGYALPEAFTGSESLNLDYQLIETADNAVVIGGDSNDYIKVASTHSIGKAVDGRGGNDLIDGGVGSTFISGGSGSNTIFIDGRASGVSWSTVTDFKLGQDKVTIWGWKLGVSKVSTLNSEVNTGGAEGYTGLTLHFENLLPNDAVAEQTNLNFNSITFSDQRLSDFGATSLDELNAQIAEQTNSHFQVGVISDTFGDHGYLYIS